jgi:hypothetical protein
MSKLIRDMILVFMMINMFLGGMGYLAASNNDVQVGIEKTILK